jgi:hypothetical protein
MTPTEFDFTITMPGDARLLDAIRQLTVHAAGYAQLPAQAGEQLAGHVERATQVAISASKAPSAQIAYRFTADPEALNVVFWCDVAPATPHPASTTNGTITVDWTMDGARRVCRIRQRLLATEA